MKYVDKKGFIQNGPVNVLVGSIKEKIKKDDTKNIPNPPVDPFISEPIDPANMTPISEVTSLSLNFKSGEIIAYRSDGTYSAYPMDERFLNHVTKEVMDETIERSQITQEDIDKVVRVVLDENSDAISSLIAAANGKNRLISAQFDNEFMDTASKVINDAFQNNPRAAIKVGPQFFRSILEGLTDRVDTKLQPEEKKE